MTFAWNDAVRTSDGVASVSIALEAVVAETLEDLCGLIELTGGVLGAVPGSPTVPLVWK